MLTVSQSEVPIATSVRLHWRGLLVIGTGVVAIGLIALVVGFELIYAGKVLPGVSADGVYLSGLSQSAAIGAVSGAAADLSAQPLVFANGATVVNSSASQLGVTYNAPAVTAAALRYGRRGDLWQRLREQARALLGRRTTFADYQYNDAAMNAVAGQLIDQLSTPVSNASLSASDAGVTVTPDQQGTRVSLGDLYAALDAHLAAAQGGQIEVATYAMTPSVDRASLESAKHQADRYLAGPVTLNVAGQTRTISPATIASWLDVRSQPAPTGLMAYYSLPPAVTISLDANPINAYVANLAASVDQAAVNAVITMNAGGQPVAASPGSNGRKLDQAAADRAITTALSAPAGQRTATLAVATVTPDVNSANLASLGINTLLSEGVSYFPGSGPNRTTNIRVGASKFNGVLIKPGGTFSFNTILGDIGPQYGYAPGYVILGNQEVKQYGGGLCQVSSTAYRAALLAGLPITARTNHSYAVSWYTAPFGVPGVDATIYLPNPDLKFVNDTPGYLLIQTRMQGTALYFDFYGTKVKSGRIRGPYFVSGSLDDTKPSHTVFYRDVLDLAGNVVKTDTVNTYYQSSLNFPIH